MGSDVEQSEGVGRPDVYFPPLDNGIDYLISVVGHLSRSGSWSDERVVEPRDLKYAVLHLQAATEVLLKARLLQEHWSLVFKDPARADRGKYESGDFETCTAGEAVARLKGIVTLTISDKQVKIIKDLAQSRNALQHYGLTASAYVVEARTADVLAFLLDFIRHHLLPGLDADVADRIQGDVEQVAESLSEIRSFVKARMNSLEPRLLSLKSSTVQCPACSQWALVVGDGEGSCLFCSKTWQSHETCERYVSEVLGVSWRSVRDGGPEPVGECPDCGGALVFGAFLASAHEVPVDLCIDCGTSFSGLESCVRCGRPFQPIEEELVCDDCFAELAAKD